MISISLALAAAPVALTFQVAEDGADTSLPVATPTVVETFAEPLTPDDPALAAAPAAPLQRVDRLYFVDEGEEQWVRGTTYKASAAPDGFSYIPFLGSDAPRTYPVRFRLESAVLAGEPVELTPTASVRRDGERITLDRGAVDVRYDFSLETVEQSFAIDAAGAAGDLVLTLAVDSDLVGRTHGAGFRFEGPDGGLDYGAAIVLDDAGQRADVTSELVGDAITLTVPASFLARAEGRVVVDPVLSTWDVRVLLTEALLEPDVAYDFTTDDYVYVFEEQFAVGSTDIYLLRTDQSGNVTDERYVRLTADTCEDPEIASHNASDTCLVVYTYLPASGDNEVRGKMYLIQSATMGGEITIGQSAVDFISERPDVGGNGSTNPNALYLVSWSRTFASGYSAPRLRAVAPNGSAGGLISPFTDIGKTVDEVVVSKGVGLTSVANYWNVAYRCEDMTTGDVEIRGAQYNWDGTPLSSDNLLYALPSGNDAVDLDISDAIEVTTVSPSYCVVYDEVGPGEEDVWVMMVRDNVRRSRTQLAFIEHGPIERNQVKPRLSTTRDDFVVSYLEQQATGFNFDVFVTTFQPVGGTLLSIAERRTIVGDTGALWSGGAAMASRFSGGNSNSAWIGMGWATFDSIAGQSSWNVEGARFASSAQDPTAFQYCMGEPNSTGDRGFITVYGDSSTTANKTLQASALPPNSVGYFVIGSLPASVPNAGGSQGTLCVGGTIGRYSNFVLNSGADGVAIYTIDPTVLPTGTTNVPAMAGQARAFQYWHRDSVGGMATSNFTNAATIVFQ